MFDNIDFRSGKVRFCSDYLEGEDILQVEYPNGYILDLGWYGEERGFYCYIVRHCEWEHPVKNYRFFQKEQIAEILDTAIKSAEELSKDKTE